MAITPFTRPMEMGDFIPQQPRLPVDAIASATQSVHKQNVKQRDRLNQIFDRIASQQLSEKDRPALKEVENRLRNQMEQLTEDGLVFDDKTRISEMARDATRNIQRAKQATQQRQKQQEVIQELENMPQIRKDLLKQRYSSPRLQTTKEGNIDPDSIPGVKRLGDEPEGGLANVAREALSNLRQETMAVGEDGQIEQQSINQDLGLLEFLSKSGVSYDRMKSAIMNEFRNNPNVQNWLDHQTTLFQASGHAPEEAKTMAENDLDTTASNIAKARSFENIDISRRNIPDSLTEDNVAGSKSPIQFSGGFEPTEDYYGKEAPQTKERKSFIKTNVQRKLSELNVPQEDIRKVIDVVQNQGKKLPESGPAGGPPQIKDEVKFGTRRAIKRMEEMGRLSEGTYEKFTNAYKNSVAGGELSPNFVMPAEDSEDFKELQQAFTTLSASQLDSPEVKQLVDESEGSYSWNPVGATDEDVENEIKREVLGNVENVAVDTEGELMRVKASANKSTPERIRGRTFTFRIPQDTNLDQTFMNMMEKNYPDQAEAMKKNNRARKEGLSVPYGQWKNIEHGRARLRRKKNGNIQLKYKDKDGRLQSPTIGTLVEEDAKPKEVQALAPMVQNMAKDLGNNPIINTELAKYAIGFAKSDGPQGEQSAKIQTRLQHYANQMDNVQNAAELRTLLERAGTTLLSKNPSFENIGVARDHAINLANQSIGQ